MKMKSAFGIQMIPDRICGSFPTFDDTKRYILMLSGTGRHSATGAC